MVEIPLYLEKKILCKVLAIYLKPKLHHFGKCFVQTISIQQSEYKSMQT